MKRQIITVIQIKKVKEKMMDRQVIDKIKTKLRKVCFSFLLSFLSNLYVIIRDTEYVARNEIQCFSRNTENQQLKTFRWTYRALKYFDRTKAIRAKKKACQWLELTLDFATATYKATKYWSYVYLLLRDKVMVQGNVY